MEFNSTTSPWTGSEPPNSSINIKDAGATFCTTPFWDTNLTWYTDDPDFTRCFHQTVLTYIPFAILLLGAPFQIYVSLTSRNRLVPWTSLNVLKLLINLSLIILPLVDLFYLIDTQSNGTSISDVHIVADIVRAAGYLLALAFMMGCKWQGEVTSGVLFLYWLSASLCGAITFRTIVRNQNFMDLPQSISPVVITIQYPLIVSMLFLNFFADAKPKFIDLEVQAEDLTPEVFASFPSKLVFSWFRSFAWKGWKRLLQTEDLWSLNLANRCKGIVPLWDRNWKKSVDQDKEKEEKKEISILPTLIRCFGVDFAWTAVLTALSSILTFASPLVVQLLIGFVEGNDPLWKGYFYTVLIILATITTTIINNQYAYRQWLIGLQVRTALTSAIYRKSLKLSNSARKEMTVGETTNLMAIDSQKFLDLTLYFNMIWSCPLQIMLCMYFLWQILGPSSLAGFGIMVFMVPFNGAVAGKMKKYQKSQMKDKDKRVKMMDEILNGIKVLKLYAWESSFSYKLLRIRDGEIGALKKAAYLNAFTTFLWTSAPFLVAVTSFSVYIFSNPNNVLDAQTAFVSITYFNMLGTYLNIIPLLLVFFVQCQVSLKRINKFMNSEELDTENVQNEEKFDFPIVAKNANFSWDDNGTDNLTNIDLEVENGSLVAVVGVVGSGKSSLLSALLGEMKRTNGFTNVFGKVAYVPQQAWIQNDTVQGNITFGKRFNKDLYDRVVENCALTPDFEMMPGGDQTEIGEKGINLSGGQKQRISVARSVYSNRSLYLLDDPLSAVDAHVSKHIFDKVIGPKGLLKNKTRVLVTHGVSYLPVVDKIVVMKDGRISETGTYQELLDKKGEFSEFLIQYISEKQEDDLENEPEVEEVKKDLVNRIGKSKLNRKLGKVRSEKSSENSEITRITNIDNASSSERTLKSSSVKEGGVVKAPVKVGQNLIETEKMEVGGVKWKIYSYYAKSVGYGASAIAVLFYVAFQGFQVGANIWLSRWVDDPLASTEDSVRNMYLGVYGTLGVCQSITIMVTTVLFALFTLEASKTLHNSMLMRILRSPMSFFETTPLGRILNRFSKDVDTCDVVIPSNLRGLLGTVLSVIGTIVVIVYAMPIFLAIVIPIALAYYFLQKFYVATARQVKRMESISRSPIYTHFGETITGGQTIRAYGRVKAFVDENEFRIDRNQMCYYPSICANRWLSIRLEFIGNTIVMFASLLAVFSRGTIDPGVVGLSLSYALNVTGALNQLVRMTTDVETNMVSVERIREYQEIAQEAPVDVPENDPPKEWPENGVIKFEDYQTRYREGLDLVLKGIDCTIMSGEKIGIVGRTGAGKSSMTLALFRIIESAGGCISIDGVNISQLGLGRLRSRITIIPQDPVLFAGTMRMNLDPFDSYPDSSIWTALEHAHLKSTVLNFAGGLEYQVTEGGSNLSVGQRQLICLARALLRKTKVLVLDEATAAVDLETDDLVQATIRQEFLDCTVLTIAHRLNTIMDSNRVMVLDQGRILEFDTPDKLMENKSSQFYSMARNAGLTKNH